jgi:hypothetical protein
LTGYSLGVWLSLEGAQRMEIRYGVTSEGWAAQSDKVMLAEG